MKIQNKLIIIIIGICLLLFIVGLIFSLENLLGINSYVMAILLISGFYLLLKNGTFQHSKLYRLCSLSIALLFISSMFKIMHWKGADILILISISSIIVLYAIHFIQKPVKNILDYGKLIIVFFFLSSRILFFFHMPYGYEIYYFSHILFISFVLYYIMIEVKTGNLKLNE